MSTDVGITFRVEWEDPGGVRAPELASTWCRLELWAGSDCISQVQERETSASRRSIYVPLYPLAEWITYNWWHLTSDRRPTLVPSNLWTYDTLVRNRDGKNSWLRNHNFRSTGEGFPWPDLTVVPEGEVSRLVWRRSTGGNPRGGLTYLTSGNVLVPSDRLQDGLASVVELALTRLDESEIRDTQLQQEWAAIQALDSEERAYCEAAARLGLDPFDTPGPLSEALEVVGRSLDGRLLDDFLDAADPTRMAAGLDWIDAATSRIADVASPRQNDLEALRAATLNSSPSLEGEPWERGYEQARRVRAETGVGELDPFPVEDYVSDVSHFTEARDFDGLGSAIDGVRLVLRRPSGRPGVRFAAARALWHGLDESAYDAFLLTRARTTKQKVERAFAAELLAPAAGIRALLPDASSLWDFEEIDDIAARFNVQPLVIEHQIENSLTAA